MTSPRKKRLPKPPQGKPIVIVESPAKSRTIGTILGDQFVVRASMGHVRDLPKRKFGIDIENGFTPTYKVLTTRKPLVRELKKLVRDAAMVYLATDPDREGEAISWHLMQSLHLKPERVKRVTFHEITRDGVLKAFASPGEISMNMVNAQQARRLLDRIVGYKLSPLLWERIAERLSAGRVQSVAVKLIVERERDIQAFASEEHWTVTAILQSQDTTFAADLAKIDGQPVKVQNKQQSDDLLTEFRSANYRIIRVTLKDKTERPYPPFTTSSLQQQASTRLDYSPKRTMIIAQQLYQGVDLGPRGPTGLITYMRTDSFRIADEALRAARQFIRTAFGETYVPVKPNVFRKKGAQDAHECIRPTHVDLTPDDVKSFLKPDQFRLYRLIWTRFVASQMKEAAYKTAEAEIRAGRGIFVARGREMKFDGFLRLHGLPLKEDQILPTLREGEPLALQDLQAAQHFTEPLPRYTEASLIKALEKYGIGRPSTYAPTLSTIQDHGYARLEARRFVPTELGVLLTGKFEKHFPKLINVEFTAKMEESLDQVEHGRAAWVTLLENFFTDFSAEFDQAVNTMTSEKNTAVDTCPSCSQPMVIRWSRFGKYIQCTNAECKLKRPAKSSEVPGQTCDRCRAPMILRFWRRGKFLACPAYPKCTFTKPILRGDKIVNVPADLDLKCEKSGHPLALRVSRRGAFLGCTGYPHCKNSKSIPVSWLVDLPKSM